MRSYSASSMGRNFRSDSSVVGGRVDQEILQHKLHRGLAVTVCSRVDLAANAVVLGFVDGAELHDVAGLEEDHEVGEVGESLGGIEDGNRGDPEHLVSARATHRVDARETASVADGEGRCV